jgi:hypothetical protein
MPEVEGYLRRKCKNIYGEEFKIQCGLNTRPDENSLAIGKVLEANSEMWTHLPRSEIKKLIEDFEKGVRGDET